MLTGMSTGLSPRVRGNHANKLPVQIHCGSIPACAGEPSRAYLLRRPRTVYPRVCGGTGAGRNRTHPGHGLSPRVRGNLRRQVADDPLSRSIPACAGEPISVFRHRNEKPVYPRVCGGTAPLLTISANAIGLSPRVRGNRSTARSARPRTRSIPACAGEPSGSCRMCGVSGVYPRVCGGTCRTRVRKRFT